MSASYNTVFINNYISSETRILTVGHTLDYICLEKISGEYRRIENKTQYPGKCRSVYMALRD